MKSLTRIFVALLLAVGITFGGFQGHAKAAPLPINVSIDADKTIEQIIGLISTSQDFSLVIANQTPHTLRRVGAYNKLSNWPVGDVDSLKAVGQDWKENDNGRGYFTFASNYAIGDTGRNVQFGASWPPIGRRKINLCTRNEAGNSPAALCLDQMSSADDRNLENSKFSAQARLGRKDNTVLWTYLVK
ncbi:MAG: hypothetical protein HWQ35_28615 [Nostoc sp. NMS1]|uniref:hypothetical protein n=1 Tax=unclassified Nostoc TaxID=2593658 RepID=UPI0025D9C981|nr:MULTISPECIES: hypothetical protein [unclassified Nostoc]MBN3910362.1 hypothetical protein [Nostoc sp. NMS1]MBN3994782.1 hypothetical protein [Nostoc sp. NMS2]